MKMSLVIAIIVSALAYIWLKPLVDALPVLFVLIGMIFSWAWSLRILNVGQRLAGNPDF